MATTQRYPVDAVLREHGWRIYSRKNGKEAVWERGEKRAVESEAVKTLPMEVREKLRGHIRTL